MSLDDEKRAVVVQLEIKKNYSTLKEAMLLAENQCWSGAASRLYYAVFHAVSALLIHDGHSVKSHKGAAIVFNQHYVKTSRVPFEYGALFSRLEDLREEGDYNCHYKVSSDELQSSLNPAKEMINTIVSMVKKKMR